MCVRLHVLVCDGMRVGGTPATTATTAIILSISAGACPGKHADTHTHAYINTMHLGGLLFRLSRGLCVY